MGCYILQSARHNATTHLGCLLLLRRTLIKRPSNTTKLAEVGRLEVPKNDGKYETGQLFLHRIFGYRGVILFPWTARIYDRDIHNSRKQQQPQPISTTQTQTQTISKSDKLGNLTNASTKANTSTSSTTATSSSSASASDTTTSDAEVGELPAIEIEKGLKLEPLLGQTTATNQQQSELKADSTNEATNKNEINSGTSTSTTSSSNANDPKDVKSKMQTFYQVLIDSRDCPYIRAQTEAVTFLGNQDSNRSLYAIPGLDYVGHDDIMPYTSADKSPLNHELFDKFLTHNPLKDPPFVGKDTLKAWQEKNHPWLELSDVHKETTENVRVTVIPFYMGCRETPASSVYWWRYCIRLENLGQLSVQLRERHWRIFSLSGTLETVRGRGVVGQEPILSTRLPAFQYSSHVSLQAPSGHMWGTFRLEREDGHVFDCKIPPFSLESKPDDNTSKRVD